MEKNCMEAFVGTYELVHVEILFPMILFCKLFFSRSLWPQVRHLYSESFWDQGLFRTSCMSPTKNWKWSICFPEILHLSILSDTLMILFHKMWSADMQPTQKRCALDHFPTTSLQDNRTQLPNRIWSPRRQGLPGTSHLQVPTTWIESPASVTFFDFVTNSGMTTDVHFLGVRSLMSPISGSKLSFLFSQHKIYLCLLTFWKPSLRGRRPLYLYDFRSFLCKNELLSFLASLLVNVFSSLFQAQLNSDSLLVNVFSSLFQAQLNSDVLFFVQGWNWMLAFCGVVRRFFPFARNL